MLSRFSFLLFVQGKVLQVRNKTSGQVVAMKVISKRLLRRKAGYIENVQAERNILTRVSHYPFVVTMHCSFQTREKLFLIMDFLAGGELFLRMGREGIFLEKDAAFYLGEIILGVDHLHVKGVLHRDLKPENILLTSHGHVCLTDFGLAKDFGPNWTSSKEEEEEGRARTICGTQEYMSPEMLANQGYGRSSDYWSVGCIAYEMLNGLPPFSSKEGSKALFQKIMKEKVKMPMGSSAAACKLLKGLLNRNVQARLGTARSTMFEVGGVSGLKKAEFFNKIDWDKLEKQELVPPYKLTVDNEQDLSNFHDEFVQMSLPRSVMDISTSSALPRRCDSDAFRGFSFIMEDFQLPDRNADDVEQYWNAQAEEDGESVSEAASSKCGFNVNNNQNYNHNNLNRIVDDNAAEAESTDADQKKRPPRKRKKKDKVAGGAASQGITTTSVASLTPTPSEAGDPPSTHVAATTLATMNVGAAINPVTPAAASKPVGQPSPASLGPAVPAQPVVTKPVPAAFGNTVPSPASKQKQQQQQQQPLNPKAESWQVATPGAGTQRTPWNTPTATTPQATPPRSATVQQNGWAKHQAQRQAIPQPTPPAHRAGGWGTPAPSPATPTPPRTTAPPGSWANRIQNSTPQPKSAAKTPSSTRAEPPQTPQMQRSEQWLTPPPQVPPPPSVPYHPILSTSSIGSLNSTGETPSPSSDWRHHSSPQVQRAKQRSSTFGSIESNGPPSLPSVNESTVKWPSLAGYPGQAQITGGGAGPLRSTVAPAIGLMKKPALKGAWAARSKP
jgi:serine/threonine protein kinase